MSRWDRDNQQPISDEQLDLLNVRQREIYCAKLSQFADYLLQEGKDPKRRIGYAEGSVTERISRFHRVVKWLWNTEGITTEITTDEADTINAALGEDRIQRVDGRPYASGSKRKINNVLQNWFEFQDVDWQPEYSFSDDDPSKENKPDPWTKEELKQLWETSLTYKSIPNYNNLTPDEREQWKAHIAQELGKPKDNVRPADWDQLNTSWKIPSLIRTARSHGWRPDLVGRMEVDWYDPMTQRIHIPAGEAPKNDASWTAELTEEGAVALDNWLEQRALMEAYDGRKEIWLNRKKNPYNSGTLNDLLRNLMEEAGIKPRGRKLVWYSFRHSIGTYVYAEYTDLEIVAEQLRQKSRAAASEYVHPLPELKQEAASIM